MEQTEGEWDLRLLLERRARYLREQLDAAEVPLAAFIYRGEPIPPEALDEAVRRRQRAYEEIEEFERQTGARV